MAWRNLAGPVTLVRSPMLTKGISGVSANASRPDSRSIRGTSGTRRGALPSTERTISWMCSGVVPQQPPTTLTRPASANSRSEEHTSELQSHLNLVCRLLLEKKKQHNTTPYLAPQNDQWPHRGVRMLTR